MGQFSVEISPPDGSVLSGNQQHEGWSLIPTAYDDGGISGGTMQRPALQQLLEAIKAKQVDVIVVYKVDRLTRSLADFARMVELFDQQGVSFVSVTQQFNTTSSMGRLTLNVLLSFAQFEREVTGERIRDKIKASKQKGIFMGGRVPRGYEVKDRRLVIREGEAELVRLIFRLYLELGSVVKLKAELERRGIRGRANKTCPSGAILTRGAIYDLLRNPVYIGFIRHKGTLHKGQHEPLLDKALWQTVQDRLDAQRQGIKQPRQAKTEASLLKNKLFDETGDSLIPTHTIKRGRRYRYYISQRLNLQPDPTGWRLPGRQLEQTVIHAAKALLADPLLVSRVLIARGFTPAQLAVATKSIPIKLETLSQAELCQSVVDQVQLQPGAMTLSLDLDILLDRTPASDNDRCLISHTVPMQMKRRGVELKLVLETRSNATAQVDQTLLNTIARAHVWFEDLLNGKYSSLREIAEVNGVSRSYVGDVLKLACLAPDMVEAIVSGHQPAQLVTDHLTKATDLPLDWRDQRHRFGFA